MGGSTACWVRELLRSSIGRKAIIAVTGLGLFGFVVGHLVGNLQVFIPDGGKSLDDYSHMLKSKPALLWGARIGLIVMVVAHVVTAIRLALENRAARPVRYRGRTWREADYASRTMIISGPLILLYVVYHLLHFTTGHAHPDFHADKVYQNLVRGFQNPVASGVYIVAMVMLGLHLSHGLWSMCQTLGVNHPKYTPALRMLSLAVAAAITVGYVSIPVCVMAGVLK